MVAEVVGDQRHESRMVMGGYGRPKSCQIFAIARGDLELVPPRPFLTQACNRVEQMSGGLVVVAGKECQHVDVFGVYLAVLGLPLGKLPRGTWRVAGDLWREPLRDQEIRVREEPA